MRLFSSLLYLYGISFALFIVTTVIVIVIVVVQFVAVTLLY